MLTSFPDKKIGDNYVAIDVETTGLSAVYGDRVIEIGAVYFAKGKVISEFEELIHTPTRISREAQRVHGISNEILYDKPLPEMVFPRFRQFIGDSVLIAHNARFDLGFIRQEFLRLGLLFSNRYICTMELARRCLPNLPNHRLETVARHLIHDLPPKLRLHRALDDARLTAHIWLALGQKRNVR